MVTRKGVIKKTSLADFQNIRANGINAINIDEGDELLDVIRTDGTKRIFIATHDGMAIRFNEKDVRPMGRATRGVRGVNLRKDDFVVSVCAVSPRIPKRCCRFPSRVMASRLRSQPIACSHAAATASSI